MEKDRDITYELVEYAVEAEYDSLPSYVVEKTKMLILDTLACCVAGSSALGIKEIVDLFNKWKGERESTILAYSHRIPAPLAAFANSAMAHARDLDDTQDVAVIHCSVPVLPAALALAEKNSSCGKDLILSVALGIEILCRTGLAHPRPQIKGWFHTTTLGCLASAIAAGKILRLDKNQMMNAVGIAYSQFAGNQQCLKEGTLTKRIQPAFTSRTGVFSALLAERGITGPKNVLEGQYGFYNLYLDGKYNRDVILDSIGRNFEILNLSMKYYPSCRGTHAAIDTALSFLKEKNIRADQIKEISVYVTPITYSLVGRPYKIGEKPQIDAQFSIPYTVSRAFIKGDIFIDDFMEKAVRDSTTLKLAEKVKVFVDKELKKPSSFLPLRMEIKTKDGKLYHKRTETLRGSPQDPMKKDELIEKFNKCADFSINPISIKKRKKIIQIVNRLDELENVNKLIELFTFEHKP